MIDLRGPATTLSPHQIRAHRLIEEALARGDRANARRLFYAHVVPDRRFPAWEVEYLEQRVGVVDEGDLHLAGRDDL